MLRYSAGVRETPSHTIPLFLLPFPPFRAALPTTHNLLRKMKLVKTFAMGAVALATIASSAFAADLGTVRITGSSAFRAASLNAIKALYTTTGTNPLVYGWAGTGSFTGSTYAIFDGNLAGGDTVRIETNFTGSSAGIQTIAQQSPVLTIPFINVARGSLSSGGTSGLATPVTNFAADIAMSDVVVGLTPWSGDGYNGLASPGADPVGVIPFYWVANGNAHASLTNVTNQIVKAAAADSLRVSFFSQNNADSGAVRVIGRNFDSGTRLTAYEEADYGALTTATQFEPTTASGTVTALTKYHAETVLGVAFGLGESGYASGGSVAGVYARPISSGLNFISYLGRSDAKAAVLAGARLLTYNGVSAPLSGVDATDNVPFVNGTYSFWSYEHMYYADSHSGDAVTNIADLVATKIATVTAANSGIANGDMKVVRGGEGQAITP